MIPRLQMSFLLEIAVESLPAAQAAQRAGADRIELCANLSQGGLTPTAELMRQVRASLHIPIFAMIRPRPGNFLYTDPEFATMQSQISQARDLAMNGVVLGILTASHHIDIRRTAQLVAQARPLPVTFHRAFDEALRNSAYPDLFAALNDVIATGATRLLTSGGAPTAPKAHPKCVNSSKPPSTASSSCPAPASTPTISSPSAAPPKPKNSTPAWAPFSPTAPPTAPPSNPKSANSPSKNPTPPDHRQRHVIPLALSLEGSGARCLPRASAKGVRSGGIVARSQ